MILISGSRMIVAAAFGSLISSQASSITPVTPLPPTAITLKAANSLVDTMKILPMLHHDCAFRLAVAKEAAHRIATGNDTMKAADPDYVLNVQMALMPMMTDTFVDKVWEEIRHRLVFYWAMEIGNARDIEAIDTFFQTVAGSTISKKFLYYEPDFSETAGFVVWDDLRSRAHDIEEEAKIDDLKKRGGTAPLSRVC